MLRHAASLLLLASLTAGQEPADSLRVYTSERERYQARTTVTRIAFGGQHRLMQEREAAWAGFTTPAQFAAWQDGVRGRLAEYFGPFPERTPLKPRLVQTIDRPAYAIEKIVFESRPGYLVTANFYRPKGRPLPLPGVFFTCGHGGEGKGYLNYHACCLGLVLKGYAVLAIDPMGQGERQEYFETAVGRGGTPWPVAQHQQLLRPSWLVGRTLSGYRVWDGIRAVDYLISRPEVDSKRLAAVGNSGGGQMALLVTAADPRIAVCAAGHPGGSCENAYLNGYTARDRELLALIPPRPCRVIVGRDSGENHADKVSDMQRVYQGLGAGEGRGELVLVDGVHNLEQPKRVAVYEWLNRWLGKEAEGAAEPSLETLSVEELWATPHGSTIKDLGSQSGTSLNSQALDLLRPPRPLPADAAAATREARRLRAAVLARVGLVVEPRRPAPQVTAGREVSGEGVKAVLLAIETEPGVTLPAALYLPADPAPGPVILHAGEWGKPATLAEESLPRALARRGLPVLSIDLRGLGETDVREGKRNPSAGGWDEHQWVRDQYAIMASGYLQRTIPAMQAFDLIRAGDALAADLRTTERPVRLLGEGYAGLPALLAAVAAPFESVTTIGTLASLEWLVRQPLHEVRNYFWMPGALADFDLPELAVAAAPQPVTWLNPTDHLAQPTDPSRCDDLTAWARAMAALLGQTVAWRQVDPGSDSLAAAVAR